MLLVPIICVMVIISISLLLLLLHLHRRHRRRSLINNLPLSFSDRRNHGDTVPEEDLRLLNLPLFKFKTASAGGSGDCAVCLASFEPEENLRLLPLCFHAFHIDCIDPWLRTNELCPICRSPVFGSESDLIRRAIEASVGTRSFRFELGSISRRHLGLDSGERSYSIGSSFHYVIEHDLEVAVVPEDENGDARAAAVTAEVTRSFRGYSDRLLSGISGRFVTGSSCRSEDFGAGDWDVEANRAGEEITDLFRWLSEV